MSPHSCFQDCDASIRLDPLWLEPQLRRAAALKILDRVGEAMQEYERVEGMKEGCLEAQEGLMDCGLDTGDINATQGEYLFL